MFEVLLLTRSCKGIKGAGVRVESSYAGGGTKFWSQPEAKERGIFFLLLFKNIHESKQQILFLKDTHKQEFFRINKRQTKKQKGEVFWFDLRKNKITLNKWLIIFLIFLYKILKEQETETVILKAIF